MLELSITAMPHERHGPSNHRWIKCLYNSLLRLRSKKISKPQLLVLYEGTHHWPADSPRKGPVTLKAFPCHDFFMNMRIMMTSWNHFPRYWPFVQGIHRSPVNSPHKGQWRGALIISLICVWINGWVNNRGAGDLRRYRAHCDVTVMWKITTSSLIIQKLQHYMDVFSILTA